MHFGMIFGFPERGAALRIHNHAFEDVWVLCKNTTVSDRASFAVPGKDARTFYLCANPVLFRPCGKIETFATSHGPEKSSCLLASTKLSIVSAKFSVGSSNFLIFPVLNCVSP